MAAFTLGTTPGFLVAEKSGRRDAASTHAVPRDSFRFIHSAKARLKVKELWLAINACICEAAASRTH